MPTNITSVSFQTAGNCRFISGNRLAGRGSAQFNPFTVPQVSRESTYGRAAQEVTRNRLPALILQSFC